jgi:transposase-like protein
MRGRSGGGVRRKASEWGEIVQEQRRSGLSVAKFATARGLNRHTLQWWRSHLRDRTGGPRKKAAFIEITPSPATVLATSAVEAVLPGGVIVRGQDGDQVARIVAALMRPC